MPFIFKGGTCLILLVKASYETVYGYRYIVGEPDTDVDTYISKASTIFPFKQCEEQVRIGKTAWKRGILNLPTSLRSLGKDIYILFGYFIC